MKKMHHKTLTVMHQSDESYRNLLNLGNSVSLHLAKPSMYETSSVNFKGMLIWNNLLYSVKSSALIFEFKRNLKT